MEPYDRDITNSSSKGTGFLERGCSARHQIKHEVDKFVCKHRWCKSPHSFYCSTALLLYCPALPSGQHWARSFDTSVENNGEPESGTLIAADSVVVFCNEHIKKTDETELKQCWYRMFEQHLLKIKSRVQVAYEKRLRFFRGHTFLKTTYNLFLTALAV